MTTKKNDKVSDAITSEMKAKTYTLTLEQMGRLQQDAYDMGIDYALEAVPVKLAQQIKNNGSICHEGDALNSYMKMIILETPELIQLLPNYHMY